MSLVKIFRVLQRIITKDESCHYQIIFLQLMLSRSKKTSTSLTLVKWKVHCFSFIKDTKWRSALGKLDASSVGTMQKYLLIAFYFEAGWWRFLPLTCKLSSN